MQQQKSQNVSNNQDLDKDTYAYTYAYISMTAGAVSATVPSIGTACMTSNNNTGLRV